MAEAGKPNSVGKADELLNRLEQSVLVCDGAMGTLLYQRGIFINRCYDELNLSAPELVLDIHRQYAAARADILETNTFGANRLKLKAHGLESEVERINQAGVRLARQAAGPEGLVAGSIGPLGVPLAPLGVVSEEGARSVFRQQALALLHEGVDLFILETFSDLNELTLALKCLRELSDVALVAQMSFDAEGVTKYGLPPEAVVPNLIAAGANVIGANCSVGPQMMLEVVERLAHSGGRFLSAQPNAGNPRMVDGRLIYLSTPEYHAEFARRFIAAGVQIVGGCCGTTPEHIKAIANAAAAVRPGRIRPTTAWTGKNPLQVETVRREEKSALAARLGKKFVLSVEVLAPRGVDAAPVLNGVRKLVGFGVDAINIPDGPRASSRMSPSALAQIIERSLPVETILHYCCRDRNLLGMQSDLLGHYALGLRNILAITGDPPKLGDYPDATAVFDVDSIGLTRMISALNQGYDLAGNAIGQATGWHIGVGANPGALDLELEIRRLHQKAVAGAEYVLTQPVFDIEQMERFFQRMADLRLPVLAGVMPLMNFRTVEFLNNEVPGVTVPEAVVRRMAAAANAEESRAIGIDIAQRSIQALRERTPIQGLYLMPPFTKDKYEIALEVLAVLR